MVNFDLLIPKAKDSTVIKNQKLELTEHEISKTRREVAEKIKKIGNVVEKIPERQSMVASLGKGAIHSVAYLIEGRKDWINKFRDEWEKVFEENPSSEEFTKTKEGQDVFAETLRLLGLQSAYIKLDVIKSIYLQTLKNYKTGNEEILSAKSLIYLRKCSDLEIEDLLALRAAYVIALSRQHWSNQHRDANLWRQKIADELDWPGQGNLSRIQTTLEEHSLINNRAYSDKSGMDFGANFGLTEFGKAFCDFAFGNSTPNASTP